MVAVVGVGLVLLPYGANGQLKRQLSRPESPFAVWPEERRSSSPCGLLVQLLTKVSNAASNAPKSGVVLNMDNIMRN